eukprot:761233-Hanusia_phi.AAC.2
MENKYRVSEVYWKRLAFRVQRWLDRATVYLSQEILPLACASGAWMAASFYVYNKYMGTGDVRQDLRRARVRTGSQFYFLDTLKNQWIFMTGFVGINACLAQTRRRAPKEARSVLHVVARSDSRIHLCCWGAWVDERSKCRSGASVPVDQSAIG